MTAGATDSDESAPEMEWDELAPGRQVSATVLMASGFVLQAGQKVRERYRVERALGEGAMGQVLAVSLVGSADRQTYALKVVARAVDANNDGVIDEDEAREAAEHAKWFAELLRAEAAKQDVAQRHGVGVARLFALVQLDDGSIGLRMELARGVSLESRIEGEKARYGEPPDVLAAVMVVRKLVSQLRRLHEMVEPGSAFGFIHSDIKPGNVFIDDSDTTDLHVTLLDFGVATAGQAMAHDIVTRHSSRKTFVLQQTGGTLGYAPPYHFTGKATPLSDVYAAIVILYEMVTLDQPWDFGDLDLSPDNILMIEGAMIGGPRPVQSVRPSVPAAHADLLDAFFAREFSALHKLAEGASQALSIPDEDVQGAMTERLTRLARDFQAKLDALAKQFSRSRFPSARPVGGPDDTASRRAMPVIPRAPALPRISDPGLPGIVVPDASTSDHAFDPSPRSVPPPPRASSAPWLFALLAVPLTAGGVYYYLQTQRARPAVTPVAPPSYAAAGARDAAVVARDAAAVTLGSSVDPLRNVPALSARGRTVRPAARAAAGTDAGATAASAPHAGHESHDGGSVAARPTAAPDTGSRGAASEAETDDPGNEETQPSWNPPARPPSGGETRPQPGRGDSPSQSGSGPSEPPASAPTP